MSSGAHDIPDSPLTQGESTIFRQITRRLEQEWGGPVPAELPMTTDGELLIPDAELIGAVNASTEAFEKLGEELHIHVKKSRRSLYGILACTAAAGALIGVLADEIVRAL